MQSQQNVRSLKLSTNFLLCSHFFVLFFLFSFGLDSVKKKCEKDEIIDFRVKNSQSSRIFNAVRNVMKNYVHGIYHPIKPDLYATSSE